MLGEGKGKTSESLQAGKVDLIVKWPPNGLPQKRTAEQLFVFPEILKNSG